MKNEISYMEIYFLVKAYMKSKVLVYLITFKVNVCRLCFCPRQSNKNWVFSHLKQLRNQTRHRKTGHKVLSIRQGKTVISERWDTNEISLIIIPSHCLETIFRLCSHEGTPGSAPCLSSTRHQAGSPERPRQLPLGGQRREPHNQRDLLKCS